jgi:hypothetical protein
MRTLLFALGALGVIAACGSSSGAPAGADAGEHADANHADSSKTISDAATEASSVSCGATTCSGDQYCIKPSCGGHDTGTPCTPAAPFCAKLPDECGDSNASCSCLGSEETTICTGDSGGGGQCSEIDQAHRSVQCMSA